MTTQKKLKEEEFLELGKKMQQFYDLGYINKKQALLFSFYKGLASGLGVFLGGTIIIALLIWVLSLFNQVPFANHFVQVLNQSLQKK